MQQFRFVRCFTLLAILLLSSSGLLVAQSEHLALDDGWRFRAVSSADHPEALTWRPASVPGVVQTDLLHERVIADPFAGDNEKRLQWIGLTDWEYVKEFDATPEILRHGHIELVFDGLDTFADVSLNGVPLLSADNMFRSWPIDVKPRLHRGRNTLRILFHSPTNLLTPIVAKLPILIPGTGYEPLDRAKGIYPVSQYMRKAPYGYGWDWGPKFVTIGIWKPVHLEMWDTARITELHLRQQSVTAERAIVEAAVDIDSAASADAVLHLHIAGPDGVELPVQTHQVRLDAGANMLRLPLRIEHAQRWFPNGYGPQNRYTIAVELAVGSKRIAYKEIRTGLRSVELQRLPDQWGKSFTFVVNGIPIFAKGANFIPLDSFPPSITDAKRRAVLTAAHDTHMNMLRIWGGGFYESDSFYDLCDELGLMVWHDFMFGGALVPGDKAFQDNVQAEAVEQVSRLSDHPSLVLWCGNNEVENAWREWSDHLEFEKGLTPEQRERIWQDYVVMFRDILKSVVAKLGNGVPYWPSSPGSNFEDVPAGQQNGDMHFWKVWSAGAPIEQYATAHPRFLSEFGFQSMPDLRTIQAFAGNDEDLNSPTLQNHERFVHGYDRMKMYLADQFRKPRDFASFVYLSQLMQAEAIEFGVETMRSRRPETMGTLFWQLDDCWPVASWSSIDSYGRWKALQYYAGRFYAPLLLVAQPNAENTRLEVHVVSDELQPRQATLHLRLMRFDGTLLQEQSRAVDVAALTSNAMEPVSLKAFDPATTFAVLTLEEKGVVMASNDVYFARPKQLLLPSPGIVTGISAEGTGVVVEIRSPVLARDVDLGFGDLDVRPAENFFDLLPNEPRRIRILGKVSVAQVKAALTVRSLADATQ